MTTDVVIVSAARRAVGRFGGSLARVPASQLASVVIAEVLERAKISPDQINDVIMGQVLQADAGLNPARQASIGAGLPSTVPARTINKQCVSGLKAVAWAAQVLRDGDSEIVIAGGQENLSMAPHVLPNSRDGARMGDWELLDSMLVDGLDDAFILYHRGVNAEDVAKMYGVGRAAQDELALASQMKAAAAREAGRFKDELVSVSIPQRKGDPALFSADEFINRKSSAEGVADLRPALDKAGSFTAGNAPGIYSRSTKPSPQRPAPCTGKRAGIQARSTSKGAQSPLVTLVTRSAHRAAVSWSRCRTKCSAAIRRKGLASLCIGGGMGIAMTLAR
jgi:acetyl-CoA C-acetyltransferase